MSNADTPIVRALYFCSAATAGVFAISALSNGLLFWAAWRASYFMIAGPTDVVMGGFSLFPKFVMSFVVGLIVLAASRWAAERITERLDPGPRRRRSVEELVAEAREDHQISLYVVLGVALAGTLFISLWGAHGFLKSGWSLATRRVAWPAVYHTGLRVAPESKLDKRCLGVDVLWLGSSAAILNCGQGVRIIHDLEALVTEPTTTVPVEED
ncbi:hypothetical protein [Caulobacter rhizosphaerae]|uniref:hypothetical protein n=1 Tax=Caulobacter rhizosphaerae TaxID=2010972 RepID=UPI0013D4665E|nr:hypothetical protein [Caulobacter rhizosphaerae]GGL35531.1 hypothetical protein GCM10010983_35640 [Caulobacter rhizosphaerae]